MSDGPTMILKAISDAFPLIRRSERHYQIPIENGNHDLWICEGGLKVKLFGESVISIHNRTGRLMQKLRSFNFKKTKKPELRTLETLLEKINEKKGIFIDAGHKDDEARICVVKVFEDGMDICVRTIKSVDSGFAEQQALQLAMKLYPGDEPIYTDCQSLEGGRVVWIPRFLNKTADALSNLRGKNHGP